MSEKKIIIRNCPAYWNQVYSCTRYTETSCQSCTDCVMKQIVELCKHAISNYGNLRFLRALSEQILQLLDIQEVK